MNHVKIEVQSRRAGKILKFRGKCKMCGKCCEAIIMEYSPEEIKRKGREAVIVYNVVAYVTCRQACGAARTK